MRWGMHDGHDDNLSSPFVATKECVASHAVWYFDSWHSSNQNWSREASACQKNPPSSHVNTWTRLLNTKSNVLPFRPRLLPVRTKMQNVPISFKKVGCWFFFRVHREIHRLSWFGLTEPEVTLTEKTSWAVQVQWCHHTLLNKETYASNSFLLFFLLFSLPFLLRSIRA